MSVCVCVIRLVLFCLALCFFITQPVSLALLPNKVNGGKVLTAIGVNLSSNNDSRPINGPLSVPSAHPSPHTSTV